MTVLRLAAIQSPVTIDPFDNATAIRALVRQAHAGGATVMHLPEGALSGYAGGDKPHFRGWNVDWTVVRAGLLSLMELAAELKVWIIVGSNHPLTAPHRPHNSVYVISSQGELTGRYDKRWLSNGEITEFYTPGTTETLFEVNGFTFGIAVCIEVNFPEVWKSYADAGADVVLFSSFSEDPVFEVIARGHAAVHGLWISVSVPAHCSHAIPAGVIGPHGYWLAETTRDRAPGYAIADLDRAMPELQAALNGARPWRAIARAGDIYRQHAVDDPRSTDKACL